MPISVSWQSPEEDDIWIWFPRKMESRNDEVSVSKHAL